MGVFFQFFFFVPRHIFSMISIMGTYIIDICSNMQLLFLKSDLTTFNITSYDIYFGLCYYFH